jgi:hypothetical protein
MALSIDVSSVTSFGNWTGVIGGDGYDGLAPLY